MPNQRKRGLKLVGAWIDESLKEQLEKLAKARGVSTSDVIIEKLTEYVDNKQPARPDARPPAENQDPS